MSSEDLPLDPPVSGDNGSSEAQVLSEIVTWSANCPAWQRDALRRLCRKDKLEQSDLDDLLEICKGEKEGNPIATDHIRDPAASNVEVSLSKLHNLQHVNALQPGETLSFNKTGLTVIYGDNGAGKSGYARVLKQACRARLPKDDIVLPNIYAAQRGTPQAEVSFRIGGQNQSVAWKQGAAADARLTAISVFDSRTAAVHVDATNDLAYTPLPLRIMAALAETCKEIKSKLDAEIRVIESQTPDILKNPECAPETEVGQLLSGLSTKTMDAKVEELAGLSETDEAQLKTLAADLANDPVQVARQLQRQKAHIDEAKERLNKLADAVSDASNASLGQLYEAHATACSASALVSADLFSDEPLPEVGSDVWRSLWEAARTYSNERAFPEQEFPVTGDDARCVLCHQELSPEATERLSRFESFVLDESKRREDEARKAYVAARSAMQETHIFMKNIHEFVSLIRDNLADEELAKTIKRSAVMNAWRLRSILKAVGVEDAVIQTPAVAVPDAEMTAHAQGLGTRASSFLAEKDSPERKALIAEHNDLAARQWLGTVKTDVLEQIKRLKAVDAIKAVRKTTATNKITTLSAALATRLVTDRLRARFAQEVAGLGVAEQHAIELRHARTSAGIPLFHVRMISKPDEPVGKIMSEGEHRCVALAAFLADLSTVETSSGIVFDDPVSSLDHNHRNRVAKRLAMESLNRQVVIFTHDIAFLVLLEAACRATRDRAAIPITYRVVSRGSDAAGFCSAEPPANVLPVQEVVMQMRNHLRNVKIHHERGDQAKWRREVHSFSAQLRKAWERAVEDAVSPVIKRLAKEVRTEGLIRLTVLQEQDCHNMRDAYRRCSQLLHSQPGELNQKLPTPGEIKAEIAVLETWAADIISRQKQIISRQKQIA